MNTEQILWNFNKYVYKTFNTTGMKVIGIVNEECYVSRQRCPPKQHWSSQQWSVRNEDGLDLTTAMDNAGCWINQRLIRYQKARISTVYYKLVMTQRDA